MSYLVRQGAESVAEEVEDNKRTDSTDAKREDGEVVASELEIPQAR